MDVLTLSQLISKPKIDEISLELLQAYYEAFLVPYTYAFTLDNGMEINLDFDKEHFCHLTGIGKVAIGSVKNKELDKYFRLEGYDNIKNGVITLQHLKKLNKGKFKQIKDKLVFFYLLPNIVESPEILLDFTGGTPSSTRIEAKLLAYSATDEVYVHVGIDEDPNTKRHFARSFFTERINDTSDGTKFISGLTPFKVVKAEKIDRRPTTTETIETA
ncbi:PBECR4 domain-containing protein [Paenibacillus sp. GP183]|uniref:PBECR4 domain-containing protein n=1 Tax=Paenibacillus sp. GP183 TaxID=1882751 RepID=UPI0008971F0A|nr:PBECR4 domain-containing protein [Paenibacillus sp. GP183]SED17814.1 hypothetical protein SAMN05443246_5965 [Paenibacillus sp. GP183]